MASQKFYAVAKGRKPGIYTHWPEAQAQVSGFQGAVYKGFKTRSEAEQWILSPSYGAGKAKSKTTSATPQTASPISDDALRIYSDGGALGNPGVGAYGVVIIDGERRRELKGGFQHTTNNRMELLGCIMGLTDVLNPTPPDRPIVVTTDSSYVVNGISKGWAKGWKNRGWLKSDGKPALNTDLWARLLELTEGGHVAFRWVKGHAGHPENERCDALVNEVTRGDGEGLVPDTEYEAQQAS
ncbi:ribonuclease H family protein [Desulfoluna sp.]|uniref:ribonuclease H family protein n=1 Tax=Desulfoluna sp. TaxID=2045199 RepID=UPI0026271842|nr:ribonuclease H family protein [Desulfoluna sp.]